MESYEYQTLFEFESSYWWFLGQHSILLDTLDSLKLTPTAMVLDAGCGTGQNLANIKERITSRANGFDVSYHAIPFWKERGLKNVYLASTNEIPLPDDTFDAVISVDILCEDAVDDEQALNELGRVTKPGGFIILIVPAYEWLMTEEHHRAVHATKRYSRKYMITMLQKLPVEIIRVTHFFAFLFPAIAGYRLALRTFSRKSNIQPRSELKHLPVVLNNLLCGIVKLEERVIRKNDLPFGSSILAVARKVSK
jgi:SAM-dependent methyltransferase